MNEDALCREVENTPLADLGIGLFYLFLGGLMGLMLVQFVRAELWSLVIYVGVGWLCCPLFLLLGGSACWDAAKATFGKLF